MDFNGVIDSSHLQWIATCAVSYLFGFTLLIRKRKNLNSTINAIIAICLVYGTATLLYTLPLFFTSDGDILLIAAYISNSFLYATYAISIYIARRIAPPTIGRSVRRITVIMAAFLIPAYLYSMYVHAQNGIIGSEGEFRFPLTDVLRITESIANAMPLLTGVLLGYSTIKSNTSKSKKVLFIALSSFIILLTSVGIVELIVKESLNNQAFANARLPAVIILLGIIMGSILFVYIGERKRERI